MTSLIVSGLILELFQVISYAFHTYSPFALFLGGLGWAGTVTFLCLMVQHGDRKAEKKRIIQRAKEDVSFEFFQIYSYHLEPSERHLSKGSLEFEKE